MLSAYIDKKTSKLVIVAINYSDTDKTIDFSGYNIQAKYETSKDKNLEHQKVTKQIITVSGRSVNTLIGSTSK